MFKGPDEGMEHSGEEREEMQCWIMKHMVDDVSLLSPDDDDCRKSAVMESWARSSSWRSWRS